MRVKQVLFAKRAVKIRHCSAVRFEKIVMLVTLFGSVHFDSVGRHPSRHKLAPAPHCVSTGRGGYRES